MFDFLDQEFLGLHDAAFIGFSKRMLLSILTAIVGWLKSARRSCEMLRMDLMTCSPATPGNSFSCVL